MLFIPAAGEMLTVQDTGCTRAEQELQAECHFATISQTKANAKDRGRYKLQAVTLLGLSDDVAPPGMDDTVSLHD